MIIIKTIIVILLLHSGAIITGRVLARRSDVLSATAYGSALITLAATVIALLLHTRNIPITAASLRACWALCFLLLLAAHTAVCRKLPWKFDTTAPQLLLPGLATFIILILPYTYFTGIDTYKWQDLAGAVQIEQNIPWLVHPLSLLGFTPRSYPSAHPLLLATIQIGGGLGVDAGFAVISIFTAVAGCASAALLGFAVFNDRKRAAIFSLLYIFTPVFTRYTHWATGRGLFLAFLPLLLFSVARPFEATPRATLQNLPLKLLPFVLLPLCHKTGLIITLAVIPLMIFNLIPYRSLPGPALRTILAGGAVLLALLIAPRIGAPFPVGNLLGAMRLSTTRFGLLLPPALLALLWTPEPLNTAPARRLYPLMLLAIPLAFEHQMYGALVAAPLITLAAASLLFLLPEPFKSHLLPTLLAITIPFTLATIIHRSLIAAPPALAHAAQFLDKFDPQGPFTVTAPGQARSRVQAYVSGCPRFNINTSTNLALRLAAPPTLSGTPAERVKQLITYLRGFLTIPEISASWYGTNPRRYFFVIDGKGTHPPDSQQIYNRDGIKIFAAPPR